MTGLHTTGQGGHRYGPRLVDDITRLPALQVRKGAVPLQHQLNYRHVISPLQSLQGVEKGSNQD